MPNTEAVKHLIETRALKERIKAENIDNIDNAFFLVMGYSRKKNQTGRGRGREDMEFLEVSKKQHMEFPRVS